MHINASVSSPQRDLPNCLLTNPTKPIINVKIHSAIRAKRIHVISQRHDRRAQHAPRRLVIVSILGVHVHAVRSQPNEYAVRARQQPLIHGPDVFVDTDIRCSEDLKDREVGDDAGHCEGDVDLSADGRPDCGVAAVAADEEETGRIAWDDRGDESAAVK